MVIQIDTPFILGEAYKRSTIHQRFGGNGRSGISSSKHYPFIFIFSSKTGLKYGYHDRWENEDVFSYSAGGQKGDMTFTSNNRALINHLINNKRVFLFEGIKKGLWRFTAELQYLHFNYGDTLDDDGNLRLGIRFFLKRINAAIPYYEKARGLNENTFYDSTVKHPDIPNETERKGLVISRVGQGAYRQSVLHRWKFQCAITGFDMTTILIASHILPWKESTNQQRLDPNNGILLSPVYDALFDRHLISFENTGKIILSDKIPHAAFNKISVTGSERILDLNSDNLFYLEKHRIKLMSLSHL